MPRAEPRGYEGVLTDVCWRDRAWLGKIIKPSVNGVHSSHLTTSASTRTKRVLLPSSSTLNRRENWNEELEGIQIEAVQFATKSATIHVVSQPGYILQNLAPNIVAAGDVPLSLRSNTHISEHHTRNLGKASS